MQEENVWPHLEDILNEESAKRQQRLAKQNGGSGGWPKTAASQP